MKRYLGDGVYAEYDGRMIKLTTEDGISTTNTIYLESEVVQSLMSFLEELRGQTK
jgi:Holliday junction resolvase